MTTRARGLFVSPRRRHGSPGRDASYGPSHASVSTSLSLLLVGFLFMRPNIFGESLTLVGSGLALASGFLSLLVQARGSIAASLDRSVLWSLFFLWTAYVWVYAATAFSIISLDAIQLTQSFLQAPMAVSAAAVTLQMPGASRKLINVFTIVVVVASISYTVSAASWGLIGVAETRVGSFPIAYWGYQPLYFPFTTSVGSQVVFGVRIPRFVGFGREPGWMALYCALAMCVVSQHGARKRLLCMVPLVVAFVGCLSTAGFGVLVTVMAILVFLRPVRGSELWRFSQQVVALVLVTIALYTAIYAPVLGLEAKTFQNGISLTEREAATRLGVEALSQSPLGGSLSGNIGASNLVAAIAKFGLPYSIAIVLCVSIPIFLKRMSRVTLAMTLLVLFTFITAQPSFDSAWIFVLLVAFFKYDRPEVEPVEGKTEGVVATGEFCAGSSKAKRRSVPA